MPAQAHLASDSYLRIAIGVGGQIEGQWDIALRDLDVAVGLDANQDGAITWNELRNRQAEVESYAFSRLTLSRNGQSCRLSPGRLMVEYHAGSAYAVLPFTVDCVSGGALTLRYRLLFDLDPGHRGLLTVDAADAIQSDVLTPEHSEVRIAGGSETFVKRGLQFLSFGFDHILLGYDHLLFITLLLLTAGLQRTPAGGWAPVGGFGRVLAEIFKTLTAFTLAHAVVLTPAVLGLVNVPGHIVEPSIAATIILAAVDNIRPILPALRWQVAFLFGLIHGLSFASTLGPMRLPSDDLALALACFNLGVEGGQIALALLLVPTVYAMRGEPAYRRIATPSISAGVGSLATIWLLDRLFSLDLLSLQSVTAAVLNH